MGQSYPLLPSENPINTYHQSIDDTDIWKHTLHHTPEDTHQQQKSDFNTIIMTTEQPQIHTIDSNM